MLRLIQDFGGQVRPGRDVDQFIEECRRAALKEACDEINTTYNHIQRVLGQGDLGSCDMDYYYAQDEHPLPDTKTKRSRYH